MHWCSKQCSGEMFGTRWDVAPHTGAEPLLPPCSLRFNVDDDKNYVNDKNVEDDDDIDEDNDDDD